MSREVTDGLPASVRAAGAPALPALAAPWSCRLLRPGLAGAPSSDAELISRWMHESHVDLFWRQAWPPQRWADTIADQLAGEYSRPLLVSLHGRPFAYLEVYRVSRDVVGQCHPTDPYDLGIHLAIGDVRDTGRGLGRTMVGAVADGLFAADPRCRRVFVDPDERHDVACRAFRAAGFRPVGVHDLGHKRAALHVRVAPVR
ncbi:GNAT family N-acetyltransferase [Solwaraspora sp. WMMB335]|uniref:GNAT family N-acetyltransferase n=1 Tax=Solwaraspora sp. WMMB335 TaxID=3404118 RepID=UPI003B939C65